MSVVTNTWRQLVRASSGRSPCCCSRAGRRAVPARPRARGAGAAGCRSAVASEAGDSVAEPVVAEGLRRRTATAAAACSASARTRSRPAPRQEAEGRAEHAGRATRPAARARRARPGGGDRRVTGGEPARRRRPTTSAGTIDRPLRRGQRGRRPRGVPHRQDGPPCPTRAPLLVYLGLTKDGSAPCSWSTPPSRSRATASASRTGPTARPSSSRSARPSSSTSSTPRTPRTSPALERVDRGRDSRPGDRRAPRSSPAFQLDLRRTSSAPATQTSRIAAYVPSRRGGPRGAAAGRCAP